MIDSTLKTGMAAAPSWAGCLPAGEGLRARAQPTWRLGFLQKPWTDGVCPCPAAACAAARGSHGRAITKEGSNKELPLSQRRLRAAPWPIPRRSSASSESEDSHQTRS